MTDTKKLTKMALLLALLCISAYISFPLPFTPVPVTALTFVMCLIALMLSPKDTFTLICVYILLGAIGLPVFVGGKSGFGTLFGPTGGFIWGWPVAYTLLSIFKGNSKSFWAYLWRSVAITIPVTYIFGIAGLMFVLKFSFVKAFMAAALPFIPGDIVKAAVAAYLAAKIKLN